MPDQGCLPDQVNGSWRMAGPKKVLVSQFSATRPRLWESGSCDESLDRTHSDLVKFSSNDVDYGRVHDRLRTITSEATRTITSRYRNQGTQRILSPDILSPTKELNLADNWIVIESPNSFNAEEEACLRSLSFAEIYARESTIDKAVQNTGDWLLESQNFRDWFQRERLREHRGFFWVQGNPGSGKSTLMKKVYSYIRTCPQDPSSVIAAFFFNARGNKIEKSPTGLFRTLLHNLCQNISALRETVVNAYVAKRKILSPDWRWQLSELKDLLAAAVKPSVLGKRSLILCVDALDECDSTATQSVIRVFEDMARVSLSEGTNFNICLSSRYWPQIRIQHCFVARVELENQGDIVRYIQEHLDPTQVKEELEAIALLKTDVRDKAKGTFLWVVLIIRELVNANLAGATLGELRRIVQRVPWDLGEFYQHQLQSTEGEDRNHMLRLLQLVFYAQRSLDLSELRHALAFGSRAYSSSADCSQSSEYVRSDEQMERRIRQHSKGLVEIAKLPSYEGRSVALSEATVQFIHQSVRDFLAKDKFSLLRDSRQRTHDADGHELFKTVCLNYLKTEDFNDIIVSLKVNNQFYTADEAEALDAKYPLLNYMVKYIFPHAAQAEKLGISQDCFRTSICSNRGYFERWRCLHDAVVKASCAPASHAQGPEARPIHVFAQYGLLTRAIAEKERNIDIVGGSYCSALVAACRGRHQNAVEILLNLGADPKFDARSRSRPLDTFNFEWRASMAPLIVAINMHDLPVLRLLLNSQRSPFTLEERFRLSKSIREVGAHSDHLEALLALLFPEATFPDSAIDDLGEVAAECTPGVLSSLLDKFDKSIVHEEWLWHGVLQSSDRYITSKIKVLLDHGGRIKITEALVDSLNVEGLNPRPNLGFSLLFEYCDVEMTEELMDSVSFFEEASQIVRTIAAKGHRFDPFTTQQLLNALQFGSAETAAFFLERRDGNTSVDEMMCSALENLEHGKEVTRLLLGHLNPDRISEQAILAALRNGPCGYSLIPLLHSRWDSLPYCEAALEVAVRYQHSETVKLVLEGYEDVRVTERILIEAMVNEDRAEPISELLLSHDPDIRVQESTVIRAIYTEYEGPEILHVFCRHGKPLLCTELIVTAAAKAESGPECLEIILQQDRGARISHSMVMKAMRAERGAALISVMHRHDHTINISEEHLIAAASECYDPSTIFAFLQTKGKLGNINPVSEFLNSGPAKRLRVSYRSLPCISTEVIQAAYSNPEEGPRLKLLELFLEWGVITEADYDNRMDLMYTSFHIPPVSQLFPEI